MSITFRNGHALATRPGLRRDWAGAIAAFDSRDYVNELGVVAIADRLEDVQRDLAAAGMGTLAWYGVRVFNDAISGTTEVPTDEDLPALLDAEDQAGRRDPYRWLGSQIHVIAAAAGVSKPAPSPATAEMCGVGSASNQPPPRFGSDGDDGSS